VNVFGTDGKVHFNSVQGEVQKRMGNFIFNTNFTWSKNMYNWANTENPYAITDKWARDANNREKYWATSLTYTLPFGRNQRWLNSAPAPVDYVLGGWTMQVVSNVASGTYVSPAYNTYDPSGTNTLGGLPDAVGNPNTGNKTRTSWYNVSAFSYDALKNGPIGRFGNATPNSIESFPINVQHLSVAKKFVITERLKLTLTGAFSNLLNHAHFTGLNNNIMNASPGFMTATRPNYEPEKTSFRQIDLKARIEW